jgi:hypothetical protein
MSEQLELVDKAFSRHTHTIRVLADVDIFAVNVSQVEPVIRKREQEFTSPWQLHQSWLWILHFMTWIQMPPPSWVGSRQLDFVHDDDQHRNNDLAPVSIVPY